MRKFSILIIDDEGNIESLQIGWRRVIDMLRNNNFIRSESDIFLPYSPGFELVSDLQIDYSVMSSENEFHFGEIAQSVDSWKNKYDLIFLDLNFKPEFFDDFQGRDEPEILFDGVNIGNVKEGQIPNFLAGLYILNLIPHSTNVKKIIFSAEDKAREFINYARLLNSRFDDISIRRYDDFDRSAEEIDAFLRAKQSVICNNLSSKTITEIGKCLADGQYEIASIPDLTEHWSLSTLFPRQINTLINLKEREFEATTLQLSERQNYFRNGLEDVNKAEEKIRAEIMQFIASYPDHLRRLALASHPSNGIDFGSYRDSIEILKSKEFYKDRSKNSIQFRPITEFLEVEPALSGGLEGNGIKNIGHKISNPALWNFHEYGAVFNNDTLRSWLMMYGFYPGYLSYILAIIRNNADRRNQIVKLTMEKSKHYLKLIVSVQGKTSQITVTDLMKMQINGTGAVANNFFGGMGCEGIEDIVKIICFRYRGFFSFSCKEGSLRFRASDQTILAETNKILTEKKFDEFSGEFQIKILTSEIEIV